MKNYYCMLLFFLMTTSGIFAQVNFEKGYFISENDQKTECYIKNEGWKYNPTNFQYRLTLDGKTNELTISDTKTVVIIDAYKFQKNTVQIDESSLEFDKLSYKRNPEFTEKTVFLNVLLEGKASLYSYEDSNIKAFYYQKEGETMELLIYKMYTNENRDLFYNKRYQQQLLTEFSCGNISEKKVTLVDYKAGDLFSFFKDYNECEGATFTQFKKVKKAKIHLGVTLGANNSKFDSNLSLLTANRNNASTDNTWSVRIGVQFEYVLPFNKDKWSAFIEPNYSSIKAEGIVQDLNIEREFGINYSAIQFPIGLRHYMFINDDSQLFINAAVLMDLVLKAESTGDYLFFDQDTFKTSVGAAFGIGYKYDKYSFEFRYNTPREILENSSQTSIEMSQFSVILGYTIF